MKNSEETQKITRPYPLPPLPPNSYYQNSPNPNIIGENKIVFTENSDSFDQYIYCLSRVVHQGHTKYQDVLIADTYNWGRILVLDGAIQSSEEDEALYHEMLVQPAMLRHPEPQDILIIGGGEGATLRETLVHRSVKSVTMVDLDREVVELSREHLVAWHRGAFDDPRVRLIYEDGRKFIQNNNSLYDVIIIDVVDMLDNGPAQSLYTRQFYELLRSRMRQNAIVVVQGLEFSFLDDKAHVALARTLRTVFPEVYSYRVDIPSFLSSWGFLIASDWFRPSEWSPEEIDRTIEHRLGSEWLDHVTGDYVKSVFSFSKETNFLLSQPGPILEDGVDFVPPPNIEDNEPPFAQFPILPKE